MNTFTLPHSVNIDGREYAVRTDYRVILEILIMLRDPDLTDGDKEEALLRMFYRDRPPDRKKAVKACLDFIDPKPASRPGPELVDWEYDFDLLAGPVNRNLGFECREAKELHWRTFVGAFLEIGPESLFSRVLRVRHKLKTGRKLEKHERQLLNHSRELVVVPSRYSEEEQEILNAWQ